MKAIVYTEYGAPDALRMEEIKPRPKDDEVLVRFHAASVNSWDGAWTLIGGSASSSVRIALIGAWLSKTGGQKMNLVLHKPNIDGLVCHSELFETGVVAPVIDKVYPLSEVPEAMRRIGAGDVLGKVVITMEVMP